MRHYLLGCSAAIIVALASSVNAQNPPAAPQAPDRTAAASAQSQSPATIEGCLVREQDVPGRAPNVAERAGAMEDYILTNAKVVKGSAPQVATTERRPDAPTGTSGSAGAAMFDVKGLDATQLKPMVGKRVQIDGAFSDVDKSASAGAKDLIDIRGTAIRQTSGECPAK